jgi:hypothetical protein
MKTRITIFENEGDGQKSIRDIIEVNDHLSDMRKTRNAIMRHFGHNLSRVLDSSVLDTIIVEREHN